MIRDDLTPEQLAAVAAEGIRLAAAAAARRAETAQAEKPNNVQREVREPVKGARNVVTLVAIRHLEIDGHVFHHGAEIAPGLLAKEVVDKLLDQGVLREYDSRDRRSLYRLFSRFSGCEDTELLSDVERTAYALPP